MKIFLYSGLVVLYLLHNDLFLWNDECLIHGIPSGLAYHLAFCVAATLLMTALTYFAWPEGLEVDSDKDSAI